MSTSEQRPSGAKWLFVGVVIVAVAAAVVVVARGGVGVTAVDVTTTAETSPEMPTLRLTTEVPLRAVTTKEVVESAIYRDVVADDDSPTPLELTLTQARTFDPNAQVGDTIRITKPDAVYSTEYVCPPAATGTGVEVSIYDASDETLIGFSRVVAAETTDACEAVFEVDLAETADFYRIELGPESDPVASKRYTAAELDALNWTLELPPWVAGNS